jgi:hypothetical protein
MRSDVGGIRRKQRKQFAIFGGRRAASTRPKKKSNCDCWTAWRWLLIESAKQSMESLRPLLPFVYVLYNGATDKDGLRNAISADNRETSDAGRSRLQASVSDWEYVSES